MVETKPGTLNTSAEGDHEPHYEPVVTLPLKETKTLEEDETELFKMHAKLYRWASECEPPEWKERGTGDVKLLQHNETNRVRLLMRRDKTLKICANHFIEKYMELTPHCGSERAWLYNAHADFSDEEPKDELLAIRFYNAEKATAFKEMFDKCIEINKNLSEKNKEKDKAEGSESTEKELETTTSNLESLKIEKEENKTSEVPNGDKKPTETEENSDEKDEGQDTEQKTENECSSSPEK